MLVWPNRANMRRWPNVVLLLAHRLRRLSNSEPTLCQRLKFAGNTHVIQSTIQSAGTLNVDLLLAHRLRRGLKSKPTLGERLMFSGNTCNTTNNTINRYSRHTSQSR